MLPRGTERSQFGRAGDEASTPVLRQTRVSDPNNIQILDGILGDFRAGTALPSCAATPLGTGHPASAEFGTLRGWHFVRSTDGDRDESERLCPEWVTVCPAAKWGERDFALTPFKFGSSALAN
jgi:hypothetical protein